MACLIVWNSLTNQNSVVIAICVLFLAMEESCICLVERSMCTIGSVLNSIVTDRLWYDIESGYGMS